MTVRPVAFGPIDLPLLMPANERGISMIDVSHAIDDTKKLPKKIIEWKGDGGTRNAENRESGPSWKPHLAR